MKTSALDLLEDGVMLSQVMMLIKNWDMHMQTWLLLNGLTSLVTTSSVQFSSRNLYLSNL